MKIRNELTGVVVSVDDTRGAYLIRRGWVQVEAPAAADDDDEPPKKKRGRPRKSEPSSE